MYGWLRDPREGDLLGVGESPRDHPWTPIGPRLSLNVHGGWARWERRGWFAGWRYIGALLPVAPTELPEFLRARVGVDDSFAYLAES